MELHEGWRELYTLQTRLEAVKVWSLGYCCREVVPTSDGAGKKEYLYIFLNFFEVAICLYLCSPLIRVPLLFKHVFGSIVTWLIMILYSMVTLFLALRWLISPAELYQFVCYLLPFWWCHQWSLNNWVSQDLLALNPCCESDSILWTSICFMILAFTICWSVLHSIDVNDTVR